MIERNKENRGSARYFLYKWCYLIHLTALLRGLKTGTAKDLLACIKNFTITSLGSLTACEKYHVAVGPWPPKIAA